MEQDKKHDIALMRYSVISPLITGLQEDFPSLDAFFCDASLKGVPAPDGSVRKYAPGTIEKWYLSYKHGNLQEQSRYPKRNYPRMSAAAIYRQLQDNGSIRHGELS